MAFGISGILLIVLVIGVLFVVYRLASGTVRAFSSKSATMLCPHCKTEANVVRGTCVNCGEDV
jgi:hypothetical protein